MYCRFGNPELFCGGADGRVMLDDILAEDNGSVLRIRFWCKLHYSHSNANLWLCYTKRHLKFGKNQADNLAAVFNRFI